MSPHGALPWRALVVLLVGLLTLAGLTGCATGSQTPSAAPTASQATGSLADSRQSDAGIVPGYSISIPKLGVTSDLVGLGLNPDRSIQVPPLADPMQAGVYTKGPLPGQVGPSVVLAHVNANGRPGFGAGFHTLAAGDSVDVVTPTAPARFTVTRTETVPKAEFPTAEVYSDTGGPELRMITYGGTLDRAAHDYLGQTIVFARRV